MRLLLDWMLLGWWIMIFGARIPQVSHIYIYIYIPREHKWPLFLKVNPPKNKAFSNQNKGHLASRYIYIYLYIQGSTYPTANISHLQGKPENHRLKSTSWDWGYVSFRECTQCTPLFLETPVCVYLDQLRFFSSTLERPSNSSLWVHLFAEIGPQFGECPLGF